MPRVQCPLSLIEGPGRAYFAMRKGEWFLTNEVADLAGIGNSTCARYLTALSEAGALTEYRGFNESGRPLFFYQIANHKETA
ncbi:hypothetical protein vBCbaSRXM_37 [Citromicrobium phage vB_CbaS-RXM]|nr:hypothetical protein vBCbaSRXM_37 [Citromicrobium phage vB_CbaS-RXM]